MHVALINLKYSEHFYNQGRLVNTTSIEDVLYAEIVLVLSSLLEQTIIVD